MKLKKYIFSKSAYLIINFIIFLLISILMRITSISYAFIIFLFTIWFAPLIIYFIIDYFRKKSFYNEVSEIVEKLDKKYLLPELMKKPNFYEGEIFYEIIKETNRSMHENVSYYKNMQEEYRDYIEAWVHEIKTPIALTKLFGENNEDIKTKNIILSEMKKIEGYVDQALYYARSTAVNKDYIVKEFEICDVLKKVIRENRREFINRRININIEGVKGKAITDVKWVEFILNQIIVNSIKYSKEENASIKAYTLERVDNIILVIEDNGVGICKEDVSRVFNKGFTGKNGRIYGKSTGIGLYLCKKLCLKLGLDILLESKEGEGTNVKLIFPLGNLTRLN